MEFGLSKQDPNVTKDRDLYVGGSDIATILGINKYKTQYELALEKTGLVEREYESNEYTQYGDILEPQIRDYINEAYEMDFKADTRIDDKNKIRGNCDGHDSSGDVVLEIKTHGKVYDERVYEAQLQLYLHLFKAKRGWLALYERPSNFDIEFDPERLEVKEVKRDQEWIDKMLNSIGIFWIRCLYLQESPDMTEEKFMTYGTEMDGVLVQLNDITPQLVAWKAQVKEMEEREKALKDRLYEVMDANDIKKLETPFLTLTRVLPTTASRFDSKMFKEDFPKLYEDYIVPSERKGYVKIKIKEEE